MFDMISQKITRFQEERGKIQNSPELENIPLLENKQQFSVPFMFVGKDADEICKVLKNQNIQTREDLRTAFGEALYNRANRIYQHYQGNIPHVLEYLNINDEKSYPRLTLLNRFCRDVAMQCYDNPIQVVEEKQDFVQDTFHSIRHRRGFKYNTEAVARSAIQAIQMGSYSREQIWRSIPDEKGVTYSIADLTRTFEVKTYTLSQLVDLSEILEFHREHLAELEEHHDPLFFQLLGEQYKNLTPQKKLLTHWFIQHAKDPQTSKNRLYLDSLVTQDGVRNFLEYSLKELGDNIHKELSPHKGWWGDLFNNNKKNVNKVYITHQFRNTYSFYVGLVLLTAAIVVAVGFTWGWTVVGMLIAAGITAGAIIFVVLPLKASLAALHRRVRAKNLRKQGITRHYQVQKISEFLHPEKNPDLESRNIPGNDIQKSQNKRKIQKFWERFIQRIINNYHNTWRKRFPRFFKWFSLGFYWNHQSEDSKRLIATLSASEDDCTLKQKRKALAHYIQDPENKNPQDFDATVFYESKDSERTGTHLGSSILKCAQFALMSQHPFFKPVVEHKEEQNSNSPDLRFI